MIEECLVLLFLGINTLSDIRYRKVLLWPMPVFFFFGIVLYVWNGSKVVSGITGLLPGIFLLAIGKLTKEAVGYGDGLTVLVMGIYLDLWDTCEIVAGGLFLSAIWGGILMILKKKEIKQEFPWMPFLMISYVGKLVTG